MRNLVLPRASMTSDALSDEALIARALADRRAFGLFYDRHVDAVYRYCFGRLGSREDAEDAASLVFARALAALPSQHGPSARSWLFAIAHNVVLNARRDARVTCSLDAVQEAADSGPGLDELAGGAERRHAVTGALARLPEEQRRVVELRLAGLTGPEIAGALGRSHDSVRTTQRRALARLRTLLGVGLDKEECRHAG